MNVEIKLGDKVREVIAGMEGTVVGICHYLGGTSRAQIKPPGSDRDGQSLNTEWYDVGRLEVIPD